MAFMSLKDIDVSYDKKKQILKGLSLDVEKGELVSLLGPSGCGKSTTLRVVAGFIDPQGGSFLLDGEDMTRFQSIRETLDWYFRVMHCSHIFLCMTTWLSAFAPEKWIRNRLIKK